MNDAISSSLFIALHDLTNGPPIIRGSLTVAPGHDYWYFIEFGTGPFHEPDGSYDDITGKLNPPSSVKRHNASGAPYEIEAKGDYLLVYMRKDGGMRRRQVAIHPGIQPMGFVRSALFDAEIFLERDMIRFKAQIKKGRKLLKRDFVVNLVNRTLETLLGQLRLTTPVDTDEDPRHADHRPHSPTLAEAWDITRAK